MKKTFLYRTLFVIILCLVLSFVFVACGESGNDEDGNETVDNSGDKCENGHSWKAATCTEPKTCTNCGTTEGGANGHSYVGGFCTSCGVEYEAYKRINSDGTENENGNYILFGSYPQTKVTDSSLNSTLTGMAGLLPTSSYSNSWTSYGYYIEGSVRNYMWYIDIEYNGETYRGVYFTSYRPNYTTYSSSTSYTYQDDNGYYTSTVYWFKYEPIKWRILTEEGGNALLLCEMIIDSQAYQNCYTSSNIDFYATDNNGNIITDDNGKKIYANNYEYSTIRRWLNDNFYNTAFNELQKEIIQLTTVNNSVSSTGYSSNSYACANTKDNIFLLSYADVINSGYGFSSSYSTYDSMRQKKNTDYAKCQGAWTSTSSGYEGNGIWWLRSPCNYSSYGARVVYNYGNANYSDRVYPTLLGVCPALWISL